MDIINYLKNNRIKLLKYLITIVVFFFLLCIIYEIFNVLFDDVYNTITLTYIVLAVLINFIPEFSPYILNNYLIYLFPFLSNYSGRGTVYIFIGLATISPELNSVLNFGGYALITTGLLCLYMNWLLSKNNKSEYEVNHDINYQNNEIFDMDRKSTNSDTNEKNEKNEKNASFEKDINEQAQNPKKIEMKEMD